MYTFTNGLTFMCFLDTNSTTSCFTSIEIGLMQQVGRQPSRRPTPPHNEFRSYLADVVVPRMAAYIDISGLPLCWTDIGAQTKLTWLIMQKNLSQLLLFLACTVLCVQVMNSDYFTWLLRCADVIVPPPMTKLLRASPRLSVHAVSLLRSAELPARPPRDQPGGWNLVPHQARTAASIPKILTS